MNTFATISVVFRFKRVTYYTVTLTDSDIPLFHRFQKRHSLPEFREDMDVIRTWMMNMGNTYGASLDYFRAERMAQAIPPGIYITHKQCRLRLYCLRLTHRAVILFDGGAKTTKKAQDCPVVRSHFALANQLAEAIWKAFDDGMIDIDEDDNLILPPNLKIPV